MTNKRATKHNKPKVLTVNHLPVSPLQFIWLLLLVLLMVAVSLGAWQVYQSVKAQPIEKVGFDGEMKYVDRKALVDKVESYLNEGFVLLNLEDMRRALIATPWVQDARVKRTAPGELLITIIEHKPVAKWGGDSLMGQTGELFQPTNILDFTDLPHFFGDVSETKKIVKQYGELLKFFEDFQLTAISLEKNANGYWKILLSNGTEVYFLEPILPIAQQRFAKIYQQVLMDDLLAVKRIDLRYSNGVAVAWRGSL